MNYIKEGFIDYWTWCKKHPINAIALQVYGCSAFFIIKDYPIVSVIMCLAIFPLVKFSMLRVVLLCALLIPSKGNAQEQPEPAGVAAGVTVVIVGGVVVYFFYSFCKKHFPKPDTNSVQQLNLGGDTTSAASQQWFGGYCIETDGVWLERNGNVLVLHATDVPVGETVVRGVVAEEKVQSLAVVSQEQTVSRDEFQSYLNNLGLPASEYGTHYSVGGVPVESWQSPIQFTERGAIPCVMINGTGEWRTNVIERTIDLQTWTPILTNIAPSNLKFSFTDNSDAPQAFYRLGLR